MDNSDKINAALQEVKILSCLPSGGSIPELISQLDSLINAATKAKKIASNQVPA